MTEISMLAIDLAKSSFQVCAVGPDGACVRPLDVALMTPRAGMLFGRLGSHRFRELQALEPRV